MLKFQLKNKELNQHQKIESEYYHFLYECLCEWASLFGKIKEGKENIFIKLCNIATPIFETFPQRIERKRTESIDAYHELIHKTTNMMQNNAEVLEVRKQIQVIKRHRTDLKKKIDRIGDPEFRKLVDDLNQVYKTYTKWKLSFSRKTTECDNERVDTEEADMKVTLVRPQKNKNFVIDPKPKSAPRCDSPVDFLGKINDSLNSSPEYSVFPDLNLGSDPETED